MFDQLSAEILASLIKGFPRTTTTTTKQNVDPAVHFVYSRVIIRGYKCRPLSMKISSAIAINWTLKQYGCTFNEFIFHGLFFRV
jgi:hypothetical protein